MQQIQEEQISSKELILKVIHLRELISNQWRLLMIFMAFGALLSLLLDWKKYKETQYNAEIIFNLEVGNAGGGGGELMGLASAFGFGGNNNRSSEIFSGENFNQLVQSRIVYERALMKEVIVNGKKLLFANYYKDSSDIARKDWGGDLFHKPNTEFINYRFTQKQPEKFSPTENEIISSIFEKLSASTDTRTVSKTSSFTAITATLNNETLTKVWLETLLSTMQEFYKELRTKKTSELLVIQERRLDSLRYVLYSTDNKLAAVTFQNQNIADASGPMREKQLNRNSGYLSTQYYTQMTNVENLRMLLINQTPLFTLLGPVRLPLEEVSWHIGNNTTAGCILGMIFAIIYLIVSKTYRDIMASKESDLGK
jgi:hypothetical protein